MDKFFSIIFLTIFLCSCGVKGDLYLPGQTPHKKISIDSSDNTTKNTNTDNKANTDK